MGFIIGAVVGSFLNMAIYRLPRKLSFSNPPKSFCPKCKHSLHAVDLIPLLSWLSTGGKCRYCKDPIAPRYFFVELLTAGLFSGIWYQFLVVQFEPIRMGFSMVAAACLVAIIYIDWELYIIPDEINALLLVIGIVMNAVLHTLPLALWGAFAGWGILWGISFLGRIAFRKDAMGHGDIKMMRGVGAIIGPTLMLANMGIAVVLGLIGGIAAIVLTRKQAEPTEASEPEEIPAPESIGSLLKYGLFYLACGDCFGLFWHAVYRLIGEEFIEESIEDDTWKPSLTTIPFGPYLAVGALACILFSNGIQNAIDTYWQQATNSSESAIRPSFHRDLVESGIKSRLTNHREPPLAPLGSKMAQMNWNKIELSLVQRNGESGAYYA